MTKTTKSNQIFLWLFFYKKLLVAGEYNIKPNIRQPKLLFASNLNNFFKLILKIFKLLYTTFEVI